MKSLTLVVEILVSLLVAAILGFALTGLVRLAGVAIPATLVMWVMVAATALAAALPIALRLRGFLMRWSASAPYLSLKDNLAGLQIDETCDWVVSTNEGLRALVQIDWPEGERYLSGRPLEPTVRRLLRRPLASIHVFEGHSAPLSYSSDEVEPILQTLIRRENQRLGQLLRQPPLRVHVSVAVEDQADADALLEDRRIQPLPYMEYLAEFLGVPFVNGPESACVALEGIPGRISTAGGTFMPLVLAEYLDSKHEANRAQYDELKDYLGDRRLMLQYVSMPFGGMEHTRMAVLQGLERMIMAKGQLEQELKESQSLYQEIKVLKHTDHPPRRLLTVVWVEVLDDERASRLKDRVSEFMLSQGRKYVSVSPARACGLYASLYPGVESFAAGRSYGAGIPGSEEEVSKELEQVRRWQGDDRPTLILEDGRGHSIGHSMWQGNNYNSITVGPSGSGKSLLLSVQVAVHLADSSLNKALLVDYGGSFDGLVEALEGQIISKSSKDRVSFSPIPRFQATIDPTAFYAEFPGSGEVELQQARREQEDQANALRKYALTLILNHLVPGNSVAFSNTLEQCWGEYLVWAQPIERLVDQLSQGVEWVKEHQSSATDEAERQSYESLAWILRELVSLEKVSSFIGDSKVDLFGARVTSINMDGFTPEEKAQLVGLIALQVNETFARATTGRTLLVFDEAHMFTVNADKSCSAIGKLIGENQRLTRKYGASQILASQNTTDLPKELIDNSNHHYINRLGKNDLCEGFWVDEPEILAHARQAAAVQECGHSWVHLGSNELQGVYRCVLDPVWIYTFESGKVLKNLMRMACVLIDVANFAELGIAVHGDDTKLIPIGGPEFTRRIALQLTDAYRAVCDVLPVLDSTEGKRLLNHFIHQRPDWEQLLRSPRALQDWLEHLEHVA